MVGQGLLVYICILLLVRDYEIRGYRTGNDTGNGNDVLILEAVIPCWCIETSIFGIGRGVEG